MSVPIAKILLVLTKMHWIANSRSTTETDWIWLKSNRSKMTIDAKSKKQLMRTIKTTYILSCLQPWSQQILLGLQKVQERQSVLYQKLNHY